MKLLRETNFIIWYVFIIIINNVHGRQIINLTSGSSIKSAEKLVIEQDLKTDITDDFKAFLKNFEELLWDLESFVEDLSITLSFENECEIPKSYMKALINDIQNTLELKEPLLSQNNCEYNLSANCSQLTKVMQCVITNLRKQIVEYTFNRSKLQNEITKWINFLSITSLNDLLQYYLPVSNKNLVYYINQDLYLLEESTYKLESKLQEENTNIGQTAFEICASEIFNNKFQYCEEEINNLFAENSKINVTEIVIKITENYHKEIIIHACSKKNSNTEEIISFIDNIVSPKLRVLGYFTLYNKIKGNNFFEGVLLINRLIKIMKSEYLQLEEEKYILNILEQMDLDIKPLLWDPKVIIQSINNNFKLVHLHKYFGWIYIDTILAICPMDEDADATWIFTQQQELYAFKIKNADNISDKEYIWRVDINKNDDGFILTSQENNAPLYTKNKIGEWISFWYSIPNNCYQVFDDDSELNHQEWKIY